MIPSRNSRTIYRNVKQQEQKEDEVYYNNDGRNRIQEETETPMK